jgi:hypothetical protein
MISSEVRADLVYRAFRRIDVGRAGPGTEL